MSTNEHVSNAVDWATPIAGFEQVSTFAMQNAQVEATLALAYEARTANLIALIPNTVTQERLNELVPLILDRLGLSKDGVPE